MKNFLFLLSFLVGFTSNVNSQTIISFDYMETWNWPGLWWGNTFNSTWATNFSVSPNLSAVIYGAGNGSSAFEQDWYVLPNITGLDPTKTYEFKFRLASYTVTSNSNTRGVDVGDFVDVQVSYNGGISYTTELRITGNNNAYWDYNTNGVINHIADGTFTNSLAPLGDIYRSGQGNQQFTGPSVITLQLPLGINQVAIDIFCRVNAAGEEWWLDNIELVEIQNNPLPVTLTSFTSSCDNGMPVLNWETASEQNSDYFQIEKSWDGFDWTVVSQVQAAGNSNQIINYQFYDVYSGRFEGYYRLKQVDFDGQFEYFGPIHTDCIESKSDFYSELFPNPTTGEIFIGIRNNQQEVVEILITDNSGRVLNRKNIDIINGYTMNTFDLSLYNTGIYQIHIYTKNRSYIHKVFKN
jgi:hypothetical protein